MVLTSTTGQTDLYLTLILAGLGLIVVAVASLIQRWRGVHRILRDSQSKPSQRPRHR